MFDIKTPLKERAKILNITSKHPTKQQDGILLKVKETNKGDKQTVKQDNKHES